MNEKDFKHLTELIYQSHQLLTAGRVTGKVQMLRDLSTEMILLLDKSEKRELKRKEQRE